MVRKALGFITKTLSYLSGQTPYAIQETTFTTQKLFKYIVNQTFNNRNTVIKPKDKHLSLSSKALLLLTQNATY